MSFHYTCGLGLDSHKVLAGLFLLELDDGGLDGRCTALEAVLDLVDLPGVLMARLPVIRNIKPAVLLIMR